MTAQEATLRALLFEALRCYDRDALLRIAAGGGPRTKGEHDVVYCPLCGCNKGGWADEPNPRTEACNDESCLCHAEDDDPRAEVLAAFDRELGR